MSNELQRYVPVSELPSLADSNESDQITWDFNLPPTVDEERVVLDMRRLSRIQAIAAFRSTHVLSYEGDTSTYTPSFNGIHADGTATAGLSGLLKKAPASQERNIDDLPNFPDIMIESGKTESVHRLNKSEIVSKVVDQRRINGRVSREMAWAKELNAALGGSIRAASREHLLLRSSRSNLSWNVGWLGLGAVSMAQEIMSHDVDGAMTLIGSMACASAINNCADLYANKKRYDETLWRQRRWTLNPIPIMQPDRYIAVDALTRVLPLVMARK